MIVEKREIDTTTAIDNPSYPKIIKRHTRKIFDLCEKDINIAERSYQITYTHQEGHEPIIDIVTNMYLEEIDGFHGDWNKFWCPEMKEQEVKKEAERCNIHIPTTDDESQKFKAKSPIKKWNTPLEWFKMELL